LEFISLVGTASVSTIALSPTALDFGTVNVGASETLTVSVTNTSAAPVTFLGVSGSGDYAGAQGTCPANGATLSAGSSCVLNVSFAPSTTGTRTGTLSLSTDATQIPLTVSLTGDAVLAQLQVTPGALSFGSVAVNASANLTLTLLNTGTATVTNLANSISGTNAADFAVTHPCSLTVLAPNQGCTEVVTFTPSVVGARGATLAVASSDPSGPAVVVLTGTGVQGGLFVLTVNGASSATATVKSGYPATYPLTLTPLNGFSGEVALTCTPIVTPQYASCSLLASTLTLNGGAQTSTVTINTITAKAAGMLLGLLLAPLAFAGRRRLRRGIGVALILVAGVSAGSALTGCGSGPSSVSDLRYTPAGTYQYQVTASATSGTSQSSTVTLNLIVQ
jgi:trimeric autotransporter adhesin